MSEGESSGSFGKWLAGVLATVVSGVAIYQLTEGHKAPAAQPNPPAASAPASQSPGLAPQVSSLAPLPAGEAPAQRREPNLSGSWQGQLSQLLADGSSAPYSYTLELSQDGNALAGTAHLQMPPPYNYWVTMKVGGAVHGATARVEDGMMLANDAPMGWLWCQKTLTLDYDESSDTLQGSWSQPGCGSGHVSLSR